MMISSFLEAATFGSCWRMDPAAALRGLASNGSPLTSRCALTDSNDSWDIYTSPRTIKRAGAFSSFCGRFRNVLKFSVTSSPTVPSPLVAPRTKTPFSYSKDMDSPSIFGSTTYECEAERDASILSPNAYSSSKLNTSCRLSNATSCVTCENVLSA